MEKMSVIVCLSCAFVAWSGCSPTKKATDDETLYSGDIRVAVEESYKPIMEEELQVYHADFPEATIHPIYCSEVEAVNLLLKDSVRLAIVDRSLSEQELASFHSRKFFPQSIPMAVGGVALVVNHENPDTVMSVDQFRDILVGKAAQWNALDPSSHLGEVQVVFNNPNSGTVRYAIDSICGGRKPASNVKTLYSNEEVIRYVASTPSALGVIGVNWIGNDEDSTRLSFNRSVKVVAVCKGDETWDDAYQPYQAYLATRQYPMTSHVYILITDPRGALPTGLMTFLTGDKGQRIILKSGLVPATQPVRLVNVKDEY